MGGAGDHGALAVALGAHGFRTRGWVVPAKDAAPRLSDGRAAAAIALIGHAGGEIWPYFSAWRATQEGIADPLDSWSKAVIGPIAAEAGGEAVFPSDRPWHPFQQWAMAAEGLKPSPLGMLIHPDYGLWHGYRGAILFGSSVAGRLAETGTAGRGQVRNHPCDDCADKPCLTACPVGTYTLQGFAVADCRAHLATAAGRQGCMQAGCLARDACPVGRSYRYGEAQIRFHMSAFA
ncbi:4Fe-4S dicluster domain-containing protein [Hoeflea olei]|uniref:Ferredoxin n=1 Tax=Hoeflea olei TaxID=1480615 RepID=A0A1C1YX30_9HYPH|nr:4Fe-4S dicluster domain-containing protein [Hoeflea olei]OCW57989.1 ferredoxin [Hoeflea olei]